MSEGPWYPYAPDQAFGARVAADQDALDRMVDGLDARRNAPPRASNKAPLLAEPRRDPAWASAAEWAALMLNADPLGEPVTTAAVLDAAPEIVRSGG